MIFFVFLNTFWEEDGLEESGVEAERIARGLWQAGVQVRGWWPGQGSCGDGAAVHLRVVLGGRVNRTWWWSGCRARDRQESREHRAL